MTALPQVEARPYGPDSTPDEIEAIRQRITLHEGDVVLYREVPVMTSFQVEVFHHRLDEISPSLPTMALLVDLTATYPPPDAMLRARLKTMFASVPNLRRVAVVTGSNFMLSVACKFVLGGIGLSRFSVHATYEDAMEALRRDA